MARISERFEYFKYAFSHSADECRLNGLSFIYRTTNVTRAFQMPVIYGILTVFFFFNFPTIIWTFFFCAVTGVTRHRLMNRHGFYFLRFCNARIVRIFILHFLHWLSQRNGLANSECQFSMAQSRTATRCRRQLRLQYYNSLVRLVNLTSCHLEVQVGFRKLDTVGWHNKANVILRT